MRIDSPAAATALGIAYVPEDRGRQGLVRPMPICENVSLANLARVSRRSFIDRKAEATLAEESVKQFQHPRQRRRPDRRQAFRRQPAEGRARQWLATEPRILIMDEPTRGIDVGAKAEIHRLMSELASRGMAILMISSELPEVLGMSDRILVMRGGRIVAEFDRADATQAGHRRGDDERRTAPCRKRRSEPMSAEATTALPATPRRRLPRFVLSQELVLALAIIALMIVVGAINPRFVAERNLQSIFLGNAYIAVAAIGMSMVIISGNIDISVGSLIGVLATISGSLAVAGVPIVLSPGSIPVALFASPSRR